jgi:hypothetical protein
MVQLPYMQDVFVSSFLKKFKIYFLLKVHFYHTTYFDNFSTQNLMMAI